MTSHLDDLLKVRQSRKFTDEPVTDEQLERCWKSRNGPVAPKIRSHGISS